VMGMPCPITFFTFNNKEHSNNDKHRCNENGFLRA
jgi:hypothetical protein